MVVTWLQLIQNNLTFAIYKWNTLIIISLKDILTNADIFNTYY